MLRSPHETKVNIRYGIENGFNGLRSYIFVNS